MYMLQIFIYMCGDCLLLTGEGMIDFPMFVEMLGKLDHDGESMDDMEEAFRVFDPSGSGYISAVDMRQVRRYIKGAIQNYHLFHKHTHRTHGGGYDSNV
jgi:Ca2+-binding EF-hand superfamily protein